MPLSEADRRLIVGHQAALAAIRKRIEVYAMTAWRGLPGYRDRDIERLVALVAPRVLAGQRQVAALTDAYLAALSGRRGIGADPALVTGAAVRNGAPTAAVYTRPGTTVHVQLSKGKSFPEAVAAGAARLSTLVRTDMQLSMRQQASYTMRASGREFYRRVLTGGRNCALCAIASTQRYHTADLMPIHPGCSCGVASIGTEDPGQVINQGLLDTLHDSISTEIGGRSDRGARDLGIGKTDAKGNAISDYTDLIVTNIHGEYGPTLGWRGDHFTGPGDIAA